MNTNFELSLRIQFYVNVNTEINDEEDFGYKICDYIASSISNGKEIHYSLHESIMNEDIPEEIKILATFYIPIEKSYDYKEASPNINNILELIPTDISFLDSRINENEELIYQYHEYFINEFYNNDISSSNSTLDASSQTNYMEKKITIAMIIIEIMVFIEMGILVYNLL